MVWHQFESGHLFSNQAAFAELLSICALSSSHSRDGALFTYDYPSSVDATQLQIYLDDAQRAIPPRIAVADHFHYLRTAAVLCLTAVQISDCPMLYRYLGLYHTVVAQYNFHNELRWPVPLSHAELQTRRTFFWSMYRLEVHSALVMGHVIRCPELQCAVRYPEQEFAGPHTSPSAVTSPYQGEWIIGWNYITDLYRMMEHMIVRFRERRISDESKTQFQPSLGFLAPPLQPLLVQIIDRRLSLPECFRRAMPPSKNREEMRCGFQVANIACTIQVCCSHKFTAHSGTNIVFRQLLQMVSYTCQDITFVDACQSAMELIQDMSCIPVEYLRAIGPSMVSLDNPSPVPFVTLTHIYDIIAPRAYWRSRDTLFLYWPTSDRRRISPSAQRDVSRQWLTTPFFPPSHHLTLFFQVLHGLFPRKPRLSPPSRHRRLPTHARLHQPHRRPPRRASRRAHGPYSNNPRHHVQQPRRRRRRYSILRLIINNSDTVSDHANFLPQPNPVSAPGLESHPRYGAVPVVPGQVQGYEWVVAEYAGDW